MKVSTNDRSVFRPVVVTVTLESEREVQGFYALFNYSPICDIIRDYGLDPAAIRESVRDAAPADYAAYQRFVREL